MLNFKHHVYSFICGFLDSISLYWVGKILLVTNPATKKIHPASLELLTTIKNTFIQIFVFMIGLPWLFRYFELDVIAIILTSLFLPLTYGYLFFYNTEVMASTKKVALWANKFSNTNFCEFDVREKVELFYSLSNQVKSFIFLILYYTPILLFCLVIISYLPLIGTLILLISESFFNSIFYFLKKWPYDRFNIGFIEKNAAYMLGYGFFVSFVCNVCLSGDFSRGAYFVISQWMIINCVLYSPPEKKFNSLSDVWKSTAFSNQRSKLTNGYNTHRQKTRNDKNYRTSLIKDIVILKPALKITEYLNEALAKSVGIPTERNSFDSRLSSDNENNSKESEITTDEIKKPENFQSDLKSVPEAPEIDE